MCAVLVQGAAVTPATTASLSPEPNWNGWNNAPVVVTLSTTDVVVGPGIRDISYSATGSQTIAPTTSVGTTARFTISSEGHTILHFFATNKDEVSEAPHDLAVSLDMTPPTIQFTGNHQVYGILETVQIACTARDALSGLLSSTCKDISGQAYLFAPAGNTFSATATDFAGNVASASTSFKLQVTYDDLCALTGTFIAGSSQTPSQAHPLGHSLCAQLDSAKAAQLRGDLTAKQHAITAYVQHVRASSHVVFSMEQVNILTALARAL